MHRSCFKNENSRHEPSASEDLAAVLLHTEKKSEDLDAKLHILEQFSIESIGMEPIY